MTLDEAEEVLAWHALNRQTIVAVTHRGDIFDLNGNLSGGPQNWRWLGSNRINAAFGSLFLQTKTTTPLAFPGGRVLAASPLADQMRRIP